jgi:hypothetical protein
MLRLGEYELTMRAQWILSLLVLLPFSPVGVLGQTASAKVPYVRVRWSGATLHITYQTAKIDHDFSEPAADQSQPEYASLFLFAIDKVRTQRLLEKDGKVYMLLDIEGPSRGPAGANSQCGAGTERALALFRFDSEGLLEEPAVVSYESCFLNIGLEDSSDDSSLTSLNSKEPFVKEFSLFRVSGPAKQDLQRVTVDARFDPLHPEFGLVTKEEVGNYKSPAKSN